MEKLISFKKNTQKQIVKFADVVKNSKFVTRFKDVTEENISFLNVKTENGVKRIKLSYIRINKRIMGRKRLSMFLHNLLNNFCDEHNNLVWLVENRSYDSVDYEECKKKIAVIIRTKNRIGKKK